LLIIFNKITNNRQPPCRGGSTVKSQQSTVNSQQNSDRDRESSGKITEILD